jgi:hypothetical protein
MDLPGADENLCALQKRFPGIEVVPISAAEGEGLSELKARLKRWLFAESAEWGGESKVETAEVAACD